MGLFKSLGNYPFFSGRRNPFVFQLVDSMQDLTTNIILFANTAETTNGQHIVETVSF